ncbi:MAG TPA: hypothetical protein DEF82_01050 [Crocinitomicaceae bacterium]|nr:hypothetical protein [Flavobacteriales bacterium]HBW85367.1 hypothetical protein [Crocinitomicaceae bacterium]
MRILFSFLFISILLSKTAYSVFWQVKYYLNQKEITEKECENKKRPEMLCNGKCYLAKQLKKAEAELNSQKEKQERSISNLKVLEEGIFVPLSAIFFEVNPNKLELSKSFFSYKNFYSYDVGSHYFHPPSKSFNV